jgi:hypothetical protein
MEYKGYRIVGDGTYGMKLIKHIGRGACPKELLGSFTSTSQAIKMIDLVLSKRGKEYVEDIRSN